MSQDRLKLLAFAPQEPWPPTDGGREGIHGALQALAARADVQFTCPNPEPESLAFEHYASIGVDYRPAPFLPRESLANLVSATLQLKSFKFHKYGNSRAVRHFDAVVGPEAPDAIICFHAHMAEAGERLMRRRGWRVPIIVREHNIEYELVASYLAALPGWAQRLAAPIEWLTRREERSIWARASATAFLSDRDFATARSSQVKGRLFLAPEGVPIPALRELVYPARQPYLLMPLNRKAPQSVANTRRFLHEYWTPLAARDALAAVEVVVTGVDPKQLEQAVGISPEDQTRLRIRATGFLPALQPVFAGALALVAPTFIGGGIRKKILEGMAHQVPVIATDLDIGTCDYFREGENILAMRDVDQFANQVQRLLSDEPLWRALAEAGRRTIEVHASWEQFADLVLQEVRLQVAASRRA